MEQRAAIQLCVKLKETGIGKFRTLKIAYGEECEVRRRARVVTRPRTERLSFNFRNTRIDGSHSKVFGRRSKLNIRMLEELTGISTRKYVSPRFENKKSVRSFYSSFVIAGTKNINALHRLLNFLK
jgi:hypothetical protein